VKKFKENMGKKPKGPPQLKGFGKKDKPRFRPKEKDFRPSAQEDGEIRPPKETHFQKRN